MQDIGVQRIGSENSWIGYSPMVAGHDQAGRYRYFGRSRIAGVATYGGEIAGTEPDVHFTTSVLRRAREPES